jgi:hypothetical protein
MVAEAPVLLHLSAALEGPAHTPRITPAVKIRTGSLLPLIFFLLVVVLIGIVVILIIVVIVVVEIFVLEVVVLVGAVRDQLEWGDTADVQVCPAVFTSQRIAFVQFVLIHVNDRFTFRTVDHPSSPSASVPFYECVRSATRRQHVRDPALQI